MKHWLRTYLLPLSAAEALDLDVTTRSRISQLALLPFLGCASEASQTAALAGGDDVVFNRVTTSCRSATLGPPSSSPTSKGEVNDSGCRSRSVSAR
ncbi:MAG TPA: hypothetical protein VMM60_03370, partial [Ilumatobacter sp.]|nr:hypothetical protein [Ilumatobacter sp.]